MSSPALQTYLAGVGPKAAPLVIALDNAIRTAQPDFDAGLTAATVCATICA